MGCRDCTNLMALIDGIKDLGKKALKEIGESEKLEILDSLQVQFLGKKGELTAILKGLKDLSVDERKEAGKTANEIREKLEEAIRDRKKVLNDRKLQSRIAGEKYDALQPVSLERGSLHPLSRVQIKVEDIFLSMGFQIMDGPEVETDANNFGSLNFSDDHPARDMQDTFWTEDGNLLRTHTSSVQVRSMEKLKPPFQIIAPGRVYRQEETDASHETTFYQVEGMMVGKDISVANLIHVMKSFLSTFFEKEVRVRLRPGYFPFVEPGFELDIGCLVCGGKGCPVCKKSGWVELMPCGMVHPNVLRAGGIDPEEWSGFAFGLGMNRLVMMGYGIEDIRHFLSGNLRFLKQF